MLVQLSWWQKVSPLFTSGLGAGLLQLGGPKGPGFGDEGIIPTSGSSGPVSSDHVYTSPLTSRNDVNPI